MTISTRAGCIGLILALGAFTASAAQARQDGMGQGTSWTPEQRLKRISLALQQLDPAEWDTGNGTNPLLNPLLTARFINGRYGGAARGPRGRAYANGHGYYGGGSRSFVNGRGGYRGGAFANGPYRAGFRNW